MKIAKDFSTYGLENSENNAYPGCDVRPGMLDRGRDAAATKTVGELISGRYRLSCPWAYRTAMAGPRDGMPTSRELSLEMIGKTRRISKLTPSAAPSVVARGFATAIARTACGSSPKRQCQSTIMRFTAPISQAHAPHPWGMLSAQLPGCLTVAVGNAADPAFAVAHPASSFGSPLCISCRHGYMRCTHSPARSSRCSS